MVPGAYGRIRFGVFEVDLHRGDLIRGNVRVKLQDTPLQILKLLIQFEGQTVPREEICEQIWPGFQGDLSMPLNEAVHSLRIVLNDDLEHPHIIESVGRQGYRLRQPVEALSSSKGAEPVRLAIFPFEYMSGNDGGYFSGGFTEQLIAHLGRTCHQIAVVTSSQTHGSAMFPLHAGRQLNCEFVLCGGLSWSGKHCRVSVRLLQVSDGLCRWAEDYLRDPADIFRIQEEIALQIAGTISNTIMAPRNENSHLVTDPGTYCKFLDAVSLMNELSEPAFQKAIDLFEYVRQLDSSFAPAYASNAIIRAFAGQYGPLYPDVVYERVNDLATRALALAPELPEAHVALGMTRMFYLADFDGAEDSFCRALTLNPSNVLANQLFSQLCTVLCRHSESIAAMQRALELDPLSPTVGTLLACAHFFAGNFEPALEQINRVLLLAPGCPTALATAGWVLTEMTHHDLALDRYHRALDAQPQSPIMMANLAYGLAASGQSQAALRLLHRVIDMRRKAWVSSYWIALVYSRLRLADKARAWFQRAEEDHDGWRILSNTDPRFQSPSMHYLHIVPSREVVVH